MKTHSDQKKEAPSKRSVNSESAPAASGDDEVQHCIAVRAYELYQERGACDGHDLDDWLQAEQTILAPEAMPESSGTSILR